MRSLALILLSAAAALTSGCQTRGTAPVPSAPPAPWAGVHGAVDGWDSTGEKEQDRHHGPALVVGEPPRLVPLEARTGGSLTPLSWSADGCWLAVSGETGVLVLGGPQATPAALCLDPAPRPDPNPLVFVWSPVGSQFALIDGARRLYVGEVATGAGRQAGVVESLDSGTMATAPGCRGPWWSEDGSCVAWVDKGGAAACLAVATEGKPVISKVTAQRLSLSPTGAYVLAYAGPGPGRTGLYRLCDARTGAQIAAFEAASAPGGDLSRVVQWNHGLEQVAVAVGTYPYRALRVLHARDGAERTVDIEPRFTFFRWLAGADGFLCATPSDGVRAVPIDAAKGKPSRLTDAIVPHNAPYNARFVAAITQAGEPVKVDLLAAEGMRFEDVKPPPGNPSALRVEGFSTIGGDMLVTVLRPDAAPPGQAGPLRQVREVWGHTDLFVCDSRTGRARPLLVDVEGTGEQPSCLVARDFTWSPDDRFVFLTYDSPTSGRGWAAIDTHTGKVTVLARGVAGRARMVPGPAPQP